MGDSVKGLGDVKKDDSYKAPFIKGPVPSVQAVQKKSLCRVGGTKARLQKKEKVIGVKMRGKLEMDKLFQTFAWDGKFASAYHFLGFSFMLSSSEHLYSS